MISIATLSNPQFDTSKYIRVSVNKPLGVSFKEVVPNGRRGVFVFDMSDGNAKATNVIKKGLFLVEADGVNLAESTFDSAIETLRKLPADRPLNLVLIHPRDVTEGPDTSAGPKETLSNEQKRGEVVEVKREHLPGTKSEFKSAMQSEKKPAEGGSNLVNDTISTVLNEPIQCGYLLAFCEREHSTENLNFIVEVNRYCDMIGNSDRVSWTRPWTDIDAELLTRTIEPKWPSIKLRETAVRAHAQKIWDDYLSEETQFQVCLRADVFRRTLNRLGRVDLYGPDVFQESLVEPIKTLRRDTLPRFLNSDLYEEMLANMESLKSLPSWDSLQVSPPTTSILNVINPKDLTETKRFTLDELLSDTFLFKEFLHVMNKSHSAENLLCVRMIAIFVELMTAKDIKGAKEEAWKIFRYFVAPGSAFEVSLYSLHKKEVMLALAMPNIHMFDELKKSATTMLTVNFNTFRGTDDYRQLATAIKASVPKSRGWSLLK